jgi:hypothetical protein
VKPGRGDEVIRSQLELHQRAVERAKKPRPTTESVFTPITREPAGP